MINLDLFSTKAKEEKQNPPKISTGHSNPVHSLLSPKREHLLSCQLSAHAMHTLFKSISLDMWHMQT